MRNRFLAAVGSAAGLTLLFAPPAFAATEFGSNCTAETPAPFFTSISLQHGAGSPLPATAPASGVITQWKTNVAANIPPGALSQTLHVFRRGAGPNRFTVVAQSSPATVNQGQNTFPARVPVQAGDRLGLRGSPSTLFCLTGDPADKTGVAETEVGPSPGQTVTFAEEASNLQVPVAATIEPDADNDGFGDETQDRCPQISALQTACPLVAVSSLAVPGKGSVSVFVATNLDAPVTVAGTASLGKGKKATLSAAPQTLVTGQVTRFVLKFPKKLKASLGELAPKQKLTLKITASATNVAGQVSTNALSAKLKGQG